ncbi:MAG: hypothetical protein ACYC2Z_08165 [Candidatus Nanopelagicales bacterium]
MLPGEIQFTRIPIEPYSPAAYSVSAVTALLLAPYRERPGTASGLPMEFTLTIDPPWSVIAATSSARAMPAAMK